MLQWLLIFAAASCGGIPTTTLSLLPTGFTTNAWRKFKFDGAVLSGDTGSVLVFAPNRQRAIGFCDLQTDTCTIQDLQGTANDPVLARAGSTYNFFWGQLAVTGLAGGDEAVFVPYHSHKIGVAHPNGTYSTYDMAGPDLDLTPDNGTGSKFAMGAVASTTVYFAPYDAPVVGIFDCGG